MASRPSSSASHSCAGLLTSPGRRADRPTTAISNSPAAIFGSRDQSSSPASGTSGSPSMMRVASDSMVGC
ncbi:Uncharacterised protein [Mycobacteroides abscessus subsp. abscessus]|nr:Uncharacterised protein [Mycobacteroides abscessus subsp. abscessus]